MSHHPTGGREVIEICLMAPYILVHGSPFGNTILTLISEQFIGFKQPRCYWRLHYVRGTERFTRGYAVPLPANKHLMNCRAERLLFGDLRCCRGLSGRMGDGPGRGTRWALPIPRHLGRLHRATRVSLEVLPSPPCITQLPSALAGSGLCQPRSILLGWPMPNDALAALPSRVPYLPSCCAAPWLALALGFPSLNILALDARPGRTENLRGWKCRPPLQTKQDFHPCSGPGEGRGHGAGHSPRPCTAPRVGCPGSSPGIDMQRRILRFVKHSRFSAETLQTRLITVISTHRGPVHLSSAPAAAGAVQNLIPALLSPSLAIYFCFNLHIIISAKTSE